MPIRFASTLTKLEVRHLTDVCFDGEQDKNLLLRKFVEAAVNPILRTNNMKSLSLPVAGARPPAPETDTVSACPMHPQVRLPEPRKGSICGMTPELVAPGAAGESLSELRGMTRRFWGRRRCIRWTFVAGERAQTGAAVLLSGTIGDHGNAVLSLRESLEFETTIESDTAALHTLVAAMLAAVPAGAIHILRDPTRGGLATTLNEIARQSGMGMMLQESAIPILPQVEAACELLGFYPLYIANEGKLVAIVAQDAATAVLQARKAHQLRNAAACIGYVTEDSNRLVQMNTSAAGQRVVDWIS